MPPQQLPLAGQLVDSLPPGSLSSRNIGIVAASMLGLLAAAEGRRVSQSELAAAAKQAGLKASQSSISKQLSALAKHWQVGWWNTAAACWHCWHAWGRCL
jgi:hypothetical protein